MARPRTFNEDEVLERAVAVFRENGFDGVSLPGLVERLGICRQSLYSVFGDKRGLYLRSLELWGRREVDAKVELLESPGSPLENLRTLIRGWADLATRCPNDGCLTVTAIVEARGDPEALAIVEGQVARLEGAFLQVLTNAQRAGELRSEVEPTQLASTLLSVAHGLGVLARLPSSQARIGASVSVMLRLLQDAEATE